jgi:hypothetical protein
MTLVVLALDALDAGLVEYFDLDGYRLEASTEMETFARTSDHPYTPEVWATVATGLEPEDHGVTEGGTSEWSNPLLEFLSRFTGALPEPTRARLGDLVSDHGAGEFGIGRTDADSMFDGPGHVVNTWPGVADGSNVTAMWELMRRNNDHGVPETEFLRTALGAGVQRVAWAREMLPRKEVVLAGTHVHTLDVCGHAFSTDEATLERVYRRVGEWVADLRAAMDEDDDLLILSDHGMLTTFYDDDDSGAHSFRAFASTTLDVAPPSSVFEVASWVDDHVDRYDPETEGDVDLPTDTLRELGYIQ